jgi:hypothetical protein
MDVAGGRVSQRWVVQARRIRATDGDDRVGEVEERLDHDVASFVAALQPVEAVVPGVSRVLPESYPASRWRGQAVINPREL